MPTLGNTEKPASSQEWFGLNSQNQHFTRVQLPAGGPWRVSQLGGWLAGVGAGASVQFVLADDPGNILTVSGAFEPANYAFGLGNSEQYSAACTPVDLPGGTWVWVGWWRHPSVGVQFGKYASGQHWDQSGNAGGAPAPLDLVAHGAGDLSAFLYYEAANQPPTAPTALVPSGGAVVNTGRTITYSWQHNDPDGGAPANAHWQLWLMPDTLGVPITEGYLGGVTSLTHTLPSGYNADRTYQWRVRTMDAAGEWSPWSNFAGFRPNSLPYAPTVNPVPTNTLTPTFTGGFSDPDPGDTQSTVDVQVIRVSDGVQVWASNYGSVPGPQWSAVYGGPALVYGVQYAVRVRSRDQYGYGAWSGYVHWTPVLPTGPTLSPNTVAVKQNDTTPDLTISQATAFTDHELEVYLPGGATLVFTSAPAAYASTTSKVVTVTTPLTPGQEYHYRARVWVGGAFGPWSGWAAFKINANPTASTVTIAADPTTGNQTATSGSGVLVTTDPTPRWSAPFADPDRIPYGDAPSARSVEVRRKDTQAALTGYPVTTGTAQTDVLTTALTADVEYEIRVGYRDNAGWPAGSYAYSAWRTIKHSAAPVVTLVAPTLAAVVTESTPLFDWASAMAAGKVQQRFRVRVFDKGPTGANYADEVQAYDSGERISADTAFTIPFGYLVDGHDYRWQADSWDTDGLMGSLTTSTFSTAFTPPPALTDVTILADIPASAVRLGWTATGLDADFGGYRVYRSLDQGVTWTLLAILSAEDAPGYVDYTAPLATTLVYRVTVSNLDFESAPVDSAVALAVDRWWIVRPGDPDLTFEMRWVMQQSDTTPRPQESFIALGRSRELIVSAAPLGQRGTIEMTVLREDAQMTTLMRAIAALPSEAVLMKNPYGEVLSVTLGSITRRREGAGVQRLTVPYIEV